MLACATAFGADILTMEDGVNRAGSDYRNFSLQRPDPRLCREACARESRCKAYTYVKPGFQGPAARCWLKYVVPPPSREKACVSGVKTRRPEAETGRAGTSVAESRPGSSRHYLELGKMAGRAGRDEEAKAYFTQAIDADPNNPEAYYVRCIANAKLGRDEEAVRDCTQAIRIAPRAPAVADAYSQRGACLQRLGETDRAVADFTEAIRRNPDDWKAYANRGNAMVTQGRIREGIADLEVANRVNPDEPRLREQLRVAHERARGRPGGQLGEQSGGQAGRQGRFGESDDSIQRGGSEGGIEVGSGQQGSGGRRRGPAPNDLEPKYPPEPTHNGKKLSEWIAQLDSKDIGEQREAALALGKFGPDARAAVGGLNRLRLYDEHGAVQRQAALALCKILGVALGDIWPKSGKRGGGPSGAPPKGRIFFLHYIQEPSEQGVVFPHKIVDENSGHKDQLFGYANLYYLDVAEAHKYRQDAAARGLDATKRLKALMDSDPTLAPPPRILDPNPRSALEAKLFRPYRHDHIIRITCNQQTSYEYVRAESPDSSAGSVLGSSHGWSKTYGGVEHFAMTAGDYDAEITIWTEEGFRLEFKVPFRIVLDLPDEEGERIDSPQDIARETRQKLAALVPGEPGFREQRFSLLQEILREVNGHLIYIGEAQPLPPADVLDYIREGFRLIKELDGLSPRGYTYAVEDLANFVKDCAEVPTPDSVHLAHDITKYLDQHIQSLQDPDDRGRALFHREVAYRYLADLVISASMDINAARALIQSQRQFDAQIIEPTGGKLKAADMVKVMEQAPQAGWWSASVDEHRPPQYAEIVGLAGGGGADDDDDLVPDDEDWAEVESEVEKSVQEAIDKLDESRAADVDFIVKNRRLLGDAGGNVETALARLEAINKLLHEIGVKVKHYEDRLKGEPVGDREGIWHTDNLLARHAELIDKEIRAQSKLEKERDELIQDTLLAFQHVIQSLESRKDTDYSEPKAAAVATAVLLKARAMQDLSKAYLYAVAGKEAEFRDAARAVERGGDAEYQTRLLEASLFQGKGDLSVALKAARRALEIKGETERGVRVQDPKTKTWSWQATPASLAVKKLELQLLSAVYTRSSADAKVIKDLAYKALAGYGRKSVSGTAYDVFWGLVSGGSGSAIGEDSYLPAAYELFRAGGELNWGVIKFMSGGWTRLTTREGAAEAASDYVDWLVQSAARVKNAGPKYWLGNEPVGEEDHRGGKLVSQMREMGSVLDDSSQTCIGLMLITQLRDFGVPLSEIRTMDIATYKQKLGEATGRRLEAGQKSAGYQLTDARARQFLSAIHFAMQQRDVKLMLEGRSQITGVEAGRPAYTESMDSLTPNWRDFVESQFSVANLLLFALPNAKIGSAGRQAGVLKWAKPTGGAATSAITVKQAAAQTFGLPRAFQWAAKQELGRRLMTDYVQVTAKMSWAGRAGLDMLIQTNATQWAKYGTEYAVSCMGTGREAQATAGRVAEIVTQITTAFGVGDVDVARQLSSQALLNQAQARMVGRGLQSAVDDVDRLAEMADANRRLLGSLQSELEGAGNLGKESHLLARGASARLDAQLQSMRRSLPAPQYAHPLVNQYYNQLAALQEALQAASEGMPVQSKRFSEMAERLAERLSEGRSSLVQQVQAINDVAGQAASAPAKPVRYSQQAVNWDIEDLDFRQPSTVPAADRLYRQGNPAKAAKLYEAAFYVYDELGMASSPAAKKIARRWQAAKEIQAAQEYWVGMQANPDVNVNAEKPITEAELTAYRRAADFELVPVGTGASKPYLVMVGGKPVGVFKLAGSGMPGALDAEVVGPRFAKALDIRVPAAARTTMPIELELEGTFTMYKSADGIASPTQADFNRILGSKNLKLIRIAGEGLESYWVTENGKRVALFIPSEVQVPDQGGVDSVFARIAKGSGGEALQTMQGVKMKLPKLQEGVFIRYVEGVDLGDASIPMAQRIFFRKQVARDWALRLVLGDYDGHGLNFKIAPNGEVFAIDRNLANILGLNEERLLKILDKNTVLSVLGTDTLSSNPVEAQRQMMKLRLALMMGAEGHRFPVYTRLRNVHQHLSYDDFATTVQAMQKWDRAFIRTQLGDVFGDQTEAAVDMIQGRIGILKETLEAKFPKLPAAPSASSARMHRKRWPTDALRLAA